RTPRRPRAGGSRAGRGSNQGRTSPRSIAACGDGAGGGGKNAPVDRAELQALQAPLKDRYREDPGAALITLRAEGTLDEEQIACSVDTGRALVEAGLHPATGGTGALACSGDMLLEALVACAGVTLRSVATSMELDVAGSLDSGCELAYCGTSAAAHRVALVHTAV